MKTHLPKNTADTLACGHGITLGGKRLLVTEVSYNGLGGRRDDAIQIHLTAVPYSLWGGEQSLYAFGVPKLIVKRRRKSKRHPVRARNAKPRKTKVKRKARKTK